MENKDKNAFPFRSEISEPEFGLTKREHFAGLAMQGLLASAPLPYNELKNTVERAVFLADELLKALEP